MTNVKFDDFLKQELRDPEIKTGVEKTKWTKLVRDVAAR